MPQYADYDQNIPYASQPPSLSPDGFHKNFTDIQSIWSQDHFTFTDLTGGLHQQSTYVNSAPIHNVAAGQVVVYSKTVAGGDQLVCQRGSDTPVVEIPILGAFSNVANGYATLPGGLILKWGAITVSATKTTIVFTPAFPTNLFSVVATARNPSASVYCNISDDSATGFTCRTSASVTFCWMAIGN